jgi:membrane-bound lytic murein transglycosylase D
MITKQRASAALICCLAIVSTDGCGPVKVQQFKTNFLPPAPKAPEILEADTDTVITAPPVSKDFIKELPRLFPSDAAVARGSEIDNRLRRAEQKFEAGKDAYREGQPGEARQAFDQAIDLLLTAPENAPDRAKLERRLDQMVEAIYRYDVNGMGAAEDGTKVVYDKSPLDGILDRTLPMDPRLKPQVKDEVRVTSSQLPLEESDSVLGYIHFFSTERGKRILTSGLRRAGRFRSLIERVLQEEEVPLELLYLAQAESGFMPRAVSNKQAVGMWQFLAWRGRQYGLEANSMTDDRLDPEKATRAAARHLRDLYGQFGDWYLAMAAYNCGPGCVSRAVERTGYADFWTLSRLKMLPAQTQNYVPAILAITIMAKNLADYGLDGIEVDRPIEYDSVKLNAPTNVALVADAVERPVSEIRELNPALLKGVAPQGYALRIPKGSEQTLSAALESVPADKRASWRIHHVEKGDTLAVIARRYSIAASAISSANNSTVSAPEAGDVLLIPASYREPAPVRRAIRSARTTSQASSHKTAMRSAPAQRVSSKVLNRRAPARRLRTASIPAESGQ